MLKLYDPRWIDDRCDRLWSPSLEAAARAAWREKKWNGMDLLYDDDDTVEGSMNNLTIGLQSREVFSSTIARQEAVPIA